MKSYGWLRFSKGNFGHLIKVWYPDVSNSFTTFDVPNGTDPVATTSTDILTLTSSGNSVVITGNSTTDNINFDILNWNSIAATTYTGSISWTGSTAPSGSTAHQCGGMQLGNMFFGWIFLKYQAAGSALTAVQMRLGDGWPTPLEPSSQSAASAITFPAKSIWMTSDIAQTNTVGEAYMLRDAGDTAWELAVREASANVKNVGISIVYPTS